MARRKQTDSDATLYDRVTKRLMNNWVVVLCVVLAAVIVSGTTVLKSLLDLWPKPEPAPVTVTASVDAGASCWDSGAEPLIKRSLVNFALNNRSSSTHVIKSAKIVPVWINTFFWAGKLGVQETFNVNLGEWYDYSESVKYGERSNERDALIKKGVAKVDKDDKLWVRPEPIPIRQMIQKDMYAIAPNAPPERYQLALGLNRSIDVLQGEVRLEFETDAGTKITSSPFSITVCEVPKDKG